MKLNYLLIVAICGVVSATSFGKIVIDDFSEVGTSPAFGETADPGKFGAGGMPPMVITIDQTEFMEDLDASQTLGTTRFMSSFTVVQPPLTGRSVGGLINEPSGSVFFESRGQASGIFSLRYGVDAAGDATVATALDESFFANGDFNRIEVNVLSADHVAQLTVKIISGVDEGDIKESSVVHNVAVGTNQIIKFMASDFVDVDFTQVDSVQLTLAGTADGDYELDFLTAIPEPATASLLAFGALGLIRRRRRSA